MLLAGALLLPANPGGKPFQTKLNKEQQALHVVERLTFGARPGDVERVRRMGVEKWIDEQLHPERIAENPGLMAKLAELKSIEMPVGELFKSYPPQQVVALMANGTMPLPADPLLRQAFEQQIARYNMKKSEGKEAAAAASSDESMEAKPTPDEIRARILSVLNADQTRTLRNGSVQEKRALLAELPEEKVDALLLALPQAFRRSLNAVAPISMRRKIMLLGNPQQVVAFDLNEAKLQRAIYSTHQLEELMVDFWYNHFNVYFDKGADRQLVPSYEREAIRPNALGKFKDLLRATAQHPAMLFYLDNWQSVGTADMRAGGKAKKNARGLNENYARELLELHTLGVDGGYTQKDVTEVARCLTGWTILDPRRNGTFTYNDRVHDKGEKIVLGVTIPAGGGKSDGDQVLDIVLHHPSTAMFLSRKLASRFVADDPPQELLNRMAKTFHDTDGDIRAVLRTMFLSKEFLSTSAFRAKVKTPFEMVVSAARAVNSDVDFAGPLAQQLAQLGQPLYRKVEPTGYSTRNAEWINSSALLGRMNFALSLAANKLPGSKTAIDGGATQDALEKSLVPSGLSTASRESLSKALEQEKTVKPEVIAGLLLGSPEFQRR